MKRRLADLHSTGHLPWSPDAIPTSSAAELMSFDDIPENEREEVGAFLAPASIDSITATAEAWR